MSLAKATYFFFESCEKLKMIAFSIMFNLIFMLKMRFLVSFDRDFNYRESD